VHGVEKKPGVALKPPIQHGRAKRQVRKTSIFAALSFNKQIQLNGRLMCSRHGCHARKKRQMQRPSPLEIGHLITLFSVSTHA
jgi:hypothetical protein